MKTITNTFITVAVCALSALAANPCAAEHPIGVQRAAANGQYVEALSQYKRISRKKVTEEAAQAAARSAWALSLPEQALEEYERAAELAKGDNTKLAPIHFSRAVVEFQEGRYQEAILRCQAAMEITPPQSPLYARQLVLLGQAYFQIGRDSLAEQKITEALDYADKNDRSEVYYARGEARYRLGKYQDAKMDFEKVSTKSERLPETIRYLARIALEAKDYEMVIFWLKKGREDFTDSFLDSWVDYAMGTAAIKAKNLTLAREIIAHARQQYPPSDSWFTLLEAQSEEIEWRASLGEF